MRIRLDRRGVLIGLVLGIGMTLSGIVVINYTQALYLVVILWIALPVMILQFIRWVRRAIRKE